MRVVHLINGLGVGGGERLVAELATRLSADVETTIYCLTRTGAVASELRARGVPVRRLSWEGIPNPIGWGRCVYDVGRADVLHTHFFYSDLLGSVLGRLLRVRRRLSTRHELGTWMRVPHRWLEPRVYRGFHRVLCVSRAVHDSLRSRGVDADRLVVVPSGIGVPPEDGLGTTERLVITVGRLERIKGHDVLIRAFAAARELEGWRLAVVGNGTERARLEALTVELGVSGRCDFVGEQPPERVRELLSKASLFVLPSRSEALGLALLEAMAARCACIATRVGGVPEVVTHGENGWLVDPGDVTGLTAALDSLASDSEAVVALGEAARVRVQNEFTIDGFVRRVEELYAGESS